MMELDDVVHDELDQSESRYSNVSSENGNQSTDSNIDQGISKRESQVVGRFKLAVSVVLIASTVIAATSIYLYLARTEEDNFEKAFEDDSNKILEAIGTSLDKSIGLLDSVAVQYVSFANFANQTWPFVTLPDFAVRMAKVLPLTDAICVNVLPIVTAENRRQWEAYSIGNDFWVNEGMSVQEKWSGYHGPKEYQGTEKFGAIHSDYGDLPYNVSRDMLPNWQNFPVIPNTPWTYNTDWVTVSFGEAYTTSVANHKATVSLPYMVPTPGDELEEFETELWSQYYADYIPEDQESKEPMSDISYPIVNDISRVETTGADNYNPAEHSVVGLIVASLYWRDVIRGILPKGSEGIQVVFENQCATSFTYQINGPTVQYMGVGDLHDTKYNYLSKDVTLVELDRFAMRKSTYSGAPIDTGYCSFTLHLYASDVLASAHKSNTPIVFTVAAVLIFIFTSLVFHLYDLVVERRQRKVLQTAVQSSAIVSSLFPSGVRDQLFPEAKNQAGKGLGLFLTANANKNKGLTDSQAGVETTAINGTTAIASLYPETTVLFADIAGFTAWSSTRQPCQVFTLLETLYAAFDEIANQRGVFKVETIGDCYVAVVGLPTPRKAHAVVMARFACDCIVKMTQVVSLLAETLGPGTAELGLRIGLNSGPTTAGVLRGEKSRFQLFGDTVNTAARMESSGKPNMIHVSEKTAERIKLAGKINWLTRREESVNCKGKGFMTTYWCMPNVQSAIPTEDSAPELKDEECGLIFPDENIKRLVFWNVDMFAKLLAEVVLDRRVKGSKKEGVSERLVVEQMKQVGYPIDEVAEVLSFPKAKQKRTVADDATVSSKVTQQLVEFITSIASMYQTNAFHNFEHCSHVVMSTKKLLDRISEGNHSEERCGIILNPLTQFAIMFAALIHDIDHPGVANAQLIKEQHELAVKYKGKSTAEQNSITKGWELLMEPRFSSLCASLLATKADAAHFRKVVVNVVMATDLFDKDLKALRDGRWETSFHSVDVLVRSNDTERRATIVLDLIIQASDVSHTMQHFTVYKKWNMSLLTEMYDAFKSGRTTKDPTEGWYEGELWFFDNYVIPLAQKLRECGVFGVSCDEFLDYARDNRLEWEMKGRDIVEEAKESLSSRADKDLLPLRVEL